MSAIDSLFLPSGLLRANVDVLQLLDESVRPPQYVSQAGAPIFTPSTVKILQDRPQLDEETRDMAAALERLGAACDRMPPQSAADKLAYVRSASKTILQMRLDAQDEANAAGARGEGEEEEENEGGEQEEGGPDEETAELITVASRHIPSYAGPPVTTHEHAARSRGTKRKADDDPLVDKTRSATRQLRLRCATLSDRIDFTSAYLTPLDQSRLAAKCNALRADLFELEDVGIIHGPIRGLIAIKTQLSKLEGYVDGVLSVRLSESANEVTRDTITISQAAETSVLANGLDMAVVLAVGMAVGYCASFFLRW